jgi:hypothetical protein
MLLCLLHSTEDEELLCCWHQYCFNQAMFSRFDGAQVAQKVIHTLQLETPDTRLYSLQNDELLGFTLTQNDQRLKHSHKFHRYGATVAELLQRSDA